MDDLEQYLRRNSLRFPNRPFPEGSIRYVNTDHIITAICKEYLNIDLSEDYVSQAYITGKPYSKGNIQIMYKMKKIKNKRRCVTVQEHVKIKLVSSGRERERERQRER